MRLSVDIPGRQTITLEHLVLDANGTLTERGELIAGVADQLHAAGEEFDVHVLTADTYGTADELAAGLGVALRIVKDGAAKRDYLEALGAERCVAIGNGANDAAMLAAAALGIAVLGPEGTAVAALQTAEVVASSILDALRPAVDPVAVAATRRP